jgi:hypothetical protein
MIENLPESMPLLAPLLICVIGAFLPWRRIYPMLKMESMGGNLPKNTRMKVRVKTFGMDTGEIPIMTNETGSRSSDIRIKCRECSKHFKRLEWMQNKECENPNCRCPEVQKLRDAANEAIDKAKDTSRVNIINIKRAAVAPTGYDAETKQYMVDVPDVMVIDMIVPKQFNRKKGK